MTTRGFKNKKARFDEKNVKEKSFKRKFGNKGREGKWPGGRGGNPKYGLKARTEREDERGEAHASGARKPKKVYASKIHKNRKR